MSNVKQYWCFENIASLKLIATDFTKVVDFQGIVESVEVDIFQDHVIAEIAGALIGERNLNLTM